MGVTALAEDNPNFFWDDTNNRLGIGTTTPLEDLHVMGSIEIVHVADQNTDHGLQISCDAAGFADVKGINLFYDTGTIGAGNDEEAFFITVDESASVAGTVCGYEILSTVQGSATVNGYQIGIKINPIVHNSGTLGDADNILNIAVDVTAALANGGAGNISAFVADNDTMTIGDAAKWAEMVFMLDTPASGAGIAPSFEFSTGGAGFTVFVPSDGTNGLRNSGAMLWDPTSLVGWATNASGRFEIRITRTRNSLGTTPIIDEIQISATSVFTWDENGDVSINSLTLVVPLTVPNGGTGLSTITDGGIMLGSGTGAVTPLGQATNGQLPIGSSGLDCVLSTLTAGTGVTITNGAGSITIDASGGGIDWTIITANQSAIVNNGFICNKASALELLLPATAAAGDIIRVTGVNTALGIKITQNASQQIHLGVSATTSGVTGFLQSSAIRDSLEMVAVVAGTSTIWNVLNSVGNWVVA